MWHFFDDRGRERSYLVSEAPAVYQTTASSLSDALAAAMPGAIARKVGEADRRAINGTWVIAAAPVATLSDRPYLQGGSDVTMELCALRSGGVLSAADAPRNAIANAAALVVEVELDPGVDIATPGDLVLVATSETASITAVDAEITAWNAAHAVAAASRSGANPSTGVQVMRANAQIVRVEATNGPIQSVVIRCNQADTDYAVMVRTVVAAA